MVVVKEEKGIRVVGTCEVQSQIPVFEYVSTGSSTTHRYRAVNHYFVTDCTIFGNVWKVVFVTLDSETGHLPGFIEIERDEVLSEYVERGKNIKIPEK